MFEGPEYASYIELCREFRLEREARPGDWFLSRDINEPVDPVLHLLMCGQDGHNGCTAPSPHSSWEVAWLPRLDQWLEMLDEDFPRIGPWWVLGGNPGSYEISPESERTTDDGARIYGSGPTREEAAARLWMALRETSVRISG